MTSPDIQEITIPDTVEELLGEDDAIDVAGARGGNVLALGFAANQDRKTRWG